MGKHAIQFSNLDPSHFQKSRQITFPLAGLCLRGGSKQALPEGRVCAVCQVHPARDCRPQRRLPDVPSIAEVYEPAGEGHAGEHQDEAPVGEGGHHGREEPEEREREKKPG